MIRRCLYRVMETSQRLEGSLSRRAPLAVFSLALSLRLVTALFVRFSSGGALFLDDQSYLSAVERAVSSGQWSEERLWTSTPSLFRPLVVVNDLTVMDPFVSQCLVGLAGSTVAVLVVLIVRRLTSSTLLAFRAGLVMAVFPSQVLWSSIVLKDALVWLGIAGSIYSLSIVSTRSRPSSKIVKAYLGSGLALILSLTIADGARPHAALILVVTAGIVSVARLKPRILFLPLVVLILAAVPASLGFGPYAIRLFENGSRSFAENRADEVAQAETPLECWTIPLLGKGDPSRGGWENDLLCLPSSTLMFLTMPWPDQAIENPSLIPPLLEAPAWIALYWGALRKSRQKWSSSPIYQFALVHVVLTAGFWSFVDRAVGTSYRHRSEILIGLVVLAIGAVKPPGNGASINSQM